MEAGQKVTYVSPHGKMEHGIVKSVSGKDHVFVVYHCCNDWDRYGDYTGERTAISDLVVGWRPLPPTPDQKEG